MSLDPKARGAAHEAFWADVRHDASLKSYRRGPALKTSLDRAIAAYLAAAPAPVAPAGVNERWYLGAMNDALFIVNRPPRPSTDDAWHERPDGPTVVLRTHPLSEADAQAIVDAHNIALALIRSALATPAASLDASPTPPAPPAKSALSVLTNGVNRARAVQNPYRTAVLVEAAKEAAAYLEQLEKHCLANDLDMHLPAGLAAPTTIADNLRHALTQGE